MNKSWMNIVQRIKDQRYEIGVNEFLSFAYREKEDSMEVPCPCKTCNNFRCHNKITIFSHLMKTGISLNYDIWIYHGESSKQVDGDDDDISFNGDDDDNDDDLDDMLNNIGQSKWGDNWQSSGESSFSIDKDLENLRTLYDESKEDLYTGCQSYTKFSFVVTLFHLKTMSGWSIKSFDALLDIFRKALPTPASVPKNFYQAKKYIRKLGFQGNIIHACVNDCVLYRKEYKLLTKCPNDKCKEPRFSGHNLNVPRKVLRYFPLKPRFQRLFVDKQIASDMRWHMEKRVNLLKSLKFPYGVSSNISRCINGEELQLSRMKSHDFYVFIQRVLPLLIRGCLTKEVRLVLYELSEFIQKLCTRNMYLDVLEKQEEKIVVILCKLERIFPSSFFDIMIHLLIHLPYEAKIAGPPQYRWMFPFERKMGTLKGYVQNKARPEGCIAERYIDNECLSFCSMYLNDVETVFNKVERNNEKMDIDGEISIFTCRGRPFGKPETCTMSENELEKIHTYILNNCHEIEEQINEHKLELELKEDNVNNVNELHDKQFASWFRQHVSSCPQSFAHEVCVLSRGPLQSVKRYSGCMVNGYRSHTQSREKDRKTQNSGVVVQGYHEENIVDFYGILKEVLEVEYLGQNKRVLIYKCDWFRIGDRNGLQIDKESGVTSINMSRKWYKDQPYILASQSKQVFYVPDIKLGNNWHVVQSSPPRALYDVPGHTTKEVYQEEEPHLDLVVDLNIDQQQPALTRGVFPLELVNASTISGKTTLSSSGIILPIDSSLSKQVSSEPISLVLTVPSVIDPFLSSKHRDHMSQMPGPGKGVSRRFGFKQRSSSLRDVQQPQKSNSSRRDVQQPYKSTYFQLQDEDEEFQDEDEELQEEDEEFQEQDEELQDQDEELQEQDEEDYEVNSQEEGNFVSTSVGASVTRKESRALSETRKGRLNNGKMLFEVDDYVGRIIGDDSQKFITKGGCVVREFAKFNATTWRNQDKTLKMDIISKCTENSTFDPNSGVMMRAIQTQLASQHKNRQYKYHIHYKKFSTKEEAIKNPPKGIKVLSDWVCLCERFACEDFQKVSERNVKNKACSEVPPAVGTVSIARLVAMKRKEGEVVSAIDQYKIGHFSKKQNKMVNDKAADILNELLSEEAVSSLSSVEVCLKKLGRIRGHLKGRSVSTKQILETQNLRRELELEKEKSKALQTEVHEMKTKQTKFQEAQEKKTRFMMKEILRLSKLQSKS